MAGVNLSSRRPLFLGPVKTPLSLSLLLNFGLIGCLLWALNRSPEANVRTTAASAAAKSRSLQQALGDAERPLPPALPVVETKPFSWSQVESSDYRTYIANLLRIGCPEQTIRDIITADLDGLYSPKREAFQRKLAAVDSSGGLMRRSGIENALDSLRDEEAATLAALLGPGRSSGQMAAEPAPRSAAGQARSAETAASVPLVFQDADAAALKLNDRQVQAMDELKQRFMDEIGGPGQDPNDAGYRERWLNAQPEIDNMMRGMIGVNAFQDYQLAARARQQQGAPGD